MCKIGWYFRASIKLLILGTLGALFIAIRYILRTPQPLESVLPGKSYLYKWTYGHVFYKVCGPIDALPLLLLHTPEVGASSYEMRHIMRDLAQHYRVYALDLLGFGFSDHPIINYSAERYVALYQDFLSNVIARPTVLLGSELSANYVVALAARELEKCKSLVLLSPSLLFEGSDRPDWLQYIAKNPLIGFLLYALLTSRWLLHAIVAQQHAYSYKYVSSEELDYKFAAAHQFGAEHAVLALLANKLELNVASTFQTLQQPTLIIWGRQGTRKSQINVNKGHSFPDSCRVKIIDDAGLRVHEERPAEVVEAIMQWSPAQTPIEERTTEPEVHVKTEPLTTIEAYCAKCRKKRIMQNQQKIVTKKGRNAMEGTCPICGTRLFRFVTT